MVVVGRAEIAEAVVDDRPIGLPAEQAVLVLELEQAGTVIAEESQDPIEHSQGPRVAIVGQRSR